MFQLKIGQLARQGGVNLQTIRYYEREGLLPKAPRLPSGYRMFSEQAVRRLNFIKEAQELGFSLAEIRELLSIQLDPARDSSRVKELARNKIADIETKVRTLQAMRRVLTRLVDACPGCGPSSDCPILESMDQKDSARKGRTGRNGR